MIGNRTTSRSHHGLLWQVDTLQPEFVLFIRELILLTNGNREIEVYNVLDVVDRAADALRCMDNFPACDLRSYMRRDRPISIARIRITPFCSLPLPPHPWTTVSATLSAFSL